MHLPDIERKDSQFNLNLTKVSTSRGESFVSPNFLFSAPSNVASFVFKPLSPSSAAKFLDSDKGGAESLLFDNPQAGRWVKEACQVNVQVFHFNPFATELLQSRLVTVSWLTSV